MRHNYYSTSISTDLWTFIICIVLVIFIMLGFNTCTASKWNHGECPNCNEDYELRAVYKGLYYYVCPDCGKEVSRYGGR